MKYKDIAVVGISGKFSSVDSISDYRNLLKDKVCTVDLPPQERLDLMKLSKDDNYMKAGYIKDISSFDNEFFDITKREAKLMSPEQRISLELVANAILDAGYSLDSFKGSNCGIYIADGESKYNDYVERQSSSSIIGSQSFMLSGQIGYHFDLRGENLTINSGCSSSLTAIHQACEKLTLGEVDTAIVGGVTLYIDVPKAKENMYDTLGIISNDYTIKSFDEKANGTVCGEGGGYVLLKPLEQAKKDGDHIYGVILSGAVNGDGGRCTNVSMPSVEAQGDVVLKAWSSLNLDGLTEIEAHGIGAPVGDAVEVQAYIDAIKKMGIDNKSIKISTVKSNIGHLFSLSGMSSLLKVLTGYKYNESYPIATLETQNPLIKFEDAGLVPLKEVYHWEKDASRMTGLSAFGLSGCNTHIVVKNYINKSQDNRVPSLLKLSAKTSNAFENIRKNILNFLSTEEYSLSDLVYTLNVGRDDYEYRNVVPVNSLVGLKNALETVKPIEVSNKEDDFKVIFAVKTENSTNVDSSKFESVFPAIKNIKNITGSPDLDLKLALYQLIISLGIKSKTLLLDKGFNSAVKLADGKISKAEFDSVFSEIEVNSDYSAYIQQVKSKNKGNKKIVLIDFTQAKGLSAVENDENVEVFYVQEPTELERLISYFYNSGKNLNWNALYTNIDYKRVSAPTYPFEKKRFWIDIKEPVKPQVQVPVANSVVETQSIVNTVKLPEKKLFVIKGEVIEDIDIFKYPYSNADYKNVFSPITSDIDTDYKLAMYRYITGKGIVPDTILADKRGKAIVSYSKGRIDKNRLREKAQIELNLNYDKAFEVIESYLPNYAVTIFDFGHTSILKDHNWNGTVRIVSLFDEGALEEYLKNPEPQYTTINVSVQQPVAQTTQPIASTQVVEQPKVAPVQNTSTSKSAEVIEAENFLEKVWANAFNLDGSIGHDEDFFALGGNSLIMQAMSDEINEHFKKKFDIFEIYDYETIEKLAVKILED